jgi:hypothetical protein
LAQFKADLQPPDLGLKSTAGNGLILGFIDPARLSVQNSYSMQVSTFGRQTVSTGLIQSTFNYYVNPQVQVRGHVGLLHSPFQSQNTMSPASTGPPGMDLNNIILGGEVTYRPADNVVFQLGFNRQPMTSNPMLYPYQVRGR